MAYSGYTALLLSQCKMLKLPVPTSELRFAPPRRWRFDLAFVDQRLAVELEGGVYSGGRHVRGVGFEKDCFKYAEAVIQGWRLLRVTNGMVKRGEAVALIERALAQPHVSTAVL